MNTRRPFYETLFQCLGQAISTRRKQLQMSQEELAAKTGVDRAFISNVERGKRNPSFGVVATIARGLKIRISRLTGMAEECLAKVEAGNGEQCTRKDGVPGQRGEYD
jgi:transcriptional regulator with XRE-family HTH domain